MILGIDPGTACGWAVVDQGIRVCGVWNLSPGRHEGGGMRYLRLERYLRELMDGRDIKMVAYEEVRRHLGTDAAHIYGGIIGTVTGVCEHRGIPYKGIPVSTIKIRATGKKGADKAKVLAAARAKWPKLVIPDDNAADALWIAECGLDELGGVA